MIKVETFELNKKRFYSKMKFHPKQIDFFNFALETINNDSDNEKITVFPARCGLGKTTFLRVFIKSWLADNKNRGLIIVTDNLQRLSELNDENDYRIAYLTAQNKATEIIRQNYCPILLISTQRYFQMDSIEQFLTYRDGENTYQRDTVIFDETPYFYCNGEIGIKELNIVHTAINEGITDLFNQTEKEWALEQYDLFRGKMIDTLNSLEQSRNKTTYLFYSPEFDSITENDTRFFSIIKDSNIIDKFKEVKKILSDIKYFVQNGGFFSSFKLADNNTYRKSFIVRQSYLDKFCLGKVKTFILDASASVSEQYPYEAEWMIMLDCDGFNVPLDYLNIHLVDVNTSRYALFSKDDRDTKIMAIKKFISDVVTDPNDTLFVSYKPLVEDGVFADIGFSAKNSLYLGNTKGFNTNKDKHTFIQVGLNRLSDINYLLTFLSNNEDFDMRIKIDIKDVQKNIAEMDSMLKSDLVDGYMSAEVIADFIQNLFRTKARDIFNREPVEAYMFCKNTENIMMELNYHLARHGANIDVLSLDELKIEKIKNRKGDTKAKQILRWLDSKGKCEFDIQEMFDALDMNSDSFKTVKRANPIIKEQFENMKIPGTRGKYLIV